MEDSSDEDDDDSGGLLQRTGNLLARPQALVKGTLDICTLKDVNIKKRAQVSFAGGTVLDWVGDLCLVHDCVVIEAMLPSFLVDVSPFEWLSQDVVGQHPVAIARQEHNHRLLGWCLKACPHLIRIRSTSISNLNPLRTKLDQTRSIHFDRVRTATKPN